MYASCSPTFSPFRTSSLVTTSSPSLPLLLPAARRGGGRVSPTTVIVAAASSSSRDPIPAEQAVKMAEVTKVAKRKVRDHPVVYTVQYNMLHAVVHRTTCVFSRPTNQNIGQHGMDDDPWRGGVRPSPVLKVRARRQKGVRSLLLVLRDIVDGRRRRGYSLAQYGPSSSPHPFYGLFCGHPPRATPR